MPNESCEPELPEYIRIFEVMPPGGEKMSNALGSYSVLNVNSVHKKLRIFSPPGGATSNIFIYSCTTVYVAQVHSFHMIPHSLLNSSWIKSGFPSVVCLKTCM